MSESIETPAAGIRIGRKRPVRHFDLDILISLVDTDHAALVTLANCHSHTSDSILTLPSAPANTFSCMSCVATPTAGSAVPAALTSSAGAAQ